MQIFSPPFINTGLQAGEVTVMDTSRFNGLRCMGSR